MASLLMLWMVLAIWRSENPKQEAMLYGIGLLLFILPAIYVELSSRPQNKLHAARFLLQSQEQPTVYSFTGSWGSGLQMPTWPMWVYISYTVTALSFYADIVRDIEGSSNFMRTLVVIGLPMAIVGALGNRATKRWVEEFRKTPAQWQAFLEQAQREADAWKTMGISQRAGYFLVRALALVALVVVVYGLFSLINKPALKTWVEQMTR